MPAIGSTSSSRRKNSTKKFILTETLGTKQNKVNRNVLNKFYDKEKNPPKKKIQTNIITKSIERIINKGLAIGFGEKTQYKLFITHLKLTAKGRKIALSLLGKQTQFIFNKKTKK